tara:strand:- start:10118 stop:13120 length:3003 start_codon:yes stop_codon:yes gene_type:complete
MAQSKFRFVSPGIQLREIDKSQIPDEPEAVGPVIIGRAQRGPALRPVKVQNFTEFVEIFGEPQPGGATGDIWRNGSDGMEPNYGAYAAQAWLANGTPLTYVRLLGQNNSGGPTTGTRQAGWQIGGTPDATRANAGALGLFLINSASATTAATGTLAAVWYCVSSSVELKGELRPHSNTVVTSSTGTGVMIRSVAAGPTFQAVVKDNAGTVIDTVDFNVKDTTAGNFIRKVFNTNPTKLTSRLYETTSSYFLGESFERDVTELVTSGSGVGDVYGFIAALTDDEASSPVIWGRNYASMTPSQTPWIIGQTEQASGSYVPGDSQELFQVIALDDGEWTQENVKVAITDIRYSNEPSNPYGTFTLMLRKASDSDENPQVVESFSNLDLNPNSPNYIARRIGDQYAKWDDDDRRYRYYGKYENNSRYVRITMKEEGFSRQELLPMGYQGPPRWGTFQVVSGNAAPTVPGISAAQTYTDFPRAICATSGAAPGYDATGIPGGSSQPLVNVNDQAFTGSFKFPRTQLRTNTTVGNLNDPTDAYFGLDTTLQGGSTRFDISYEDTVRGLQDIGRLATGPRTAVSYSAAGNVIEYSYVFSLENVSYHTASLTAATLGGHSSSIGSSQSRDGYYLSGSYKLGYSLASTGSNTYKNVLDADFNQFCVPMFGGFNGTDIGETNPFNNYYSTGFTPTLTNDSKYNSIRQAIDSCADPELVECNLMAAPGVGTTTATRGLTDHMLDICQRRGDVLAVIDIEGGYQPAPDRSSVGEDYDSTNRGKASTAANTLRDRQINNSYGACYYPWIQVRDPVSGVSFFAPPSVAAMGTFAFSQRESELWFAPAGFTRGGLTEGAGGIPIIGVTEKLTSKERDRLYENNINPIASFPAEGLVVFGQKTLQSTRSALDRVNVRRLMIHVKKEISRISSRLLFDPNTQVTWNRFLGTARPFLNSIKTRLGVDDFKIILDTTTTTPDLVDRNIMYAKIFIKPTRAIEFIAIDFVITNTGASFQD